MGGAFGDENRASEPREGFRSPPPAPPLFLLGSGEREKGGMREKKHVVGGAWGGRGLVCAFTFFFLLFFRMPFLEKDAWL